MLINYYRPNQQHYSNLYPPSLGSTDSSRSSYNDSPAASNLSARDPYHIITSKWLRRNK